MHVQAGFNGAEAVWSRVKSWHTCVGSWCSSSRSFCKVSHNRVFCLTEAAVEAFVSVRLRILCSSSTLSRIKEPLDIFMPICCLDLTQGSAAERRGASDHLGFRSHWRSGQSHLDCLWLCIAATSSMVSFSSSTLTHSSQFYRKFGPFLWKWGLPLHLNTKKMQIWNDHTLIYCKHAMLQWNHNHLTLKTVTQQFYI